MAVEQFELVLQDSIQATPSVRHLCFKRADNKPLQYKPGQFVSFLFDSEGKTKRRSYSIATIPSATPQQDQIEIAISYVKGGLASEALFNLKPGDALKAMGPAGRLVLQDEPAQRLILVGTGTGIAPYRCMLPQISAKLAANPQLKVVVLLGVQYRQDALYAEDFRQFAKQPGHEGFEFRACYSREGFSDDSRQDDEQSGYVQNQFASLQINPEQDVVYLCGNPNMIDDSFEQLTKMGLEIKKIRREKYISPN